MSQYFTTYVPSTSAFVMITVQADTKEEAFSKFKNNDRDIDIVESGDDSFEYTTENLKLEEIIEG